jgi:hypothetical protein
MNKNLIVKFSYEHLKNETHVEYNETVNGLVVRFNPQTLGISSQYSIYKTALDAEVGALDVIFKSEYTEEIIAQDHVRGGIYRGLVDAVKSARHHFNTDKRRAAEKIFVVIEHYGNISSKTFDQETAAIDDLMRELNDNHSADVQTLSLEEWLTQLDIENKAFKLLMAERYSEAAHRPVVNMREARTATDLALRAMFDMIEALAAVNGAEAYMPFIRELNVVNERYKNQLAQAEGRRSKTGKETGGGDE